MAPEQEQQQQQQLHFIMFPLMAQGHMIPMIDMARLIAQRGVIVTLVMTPLNILRFKSILDRAIQSGLPIRLLQLRFPSAEAGLPEGCENYDTLPSPDMAKNFFTATTMFQQPFEQSIREMAPKPNCIISDMCFPWTTHTASMFDIPRIVFHGPSCFYLVSSHYLTLHRPYESITSDSELFVIPGLPDRIEMTKACLPAGFSDPSSHLMTFRNKMREAELTAYGVVVNSVDALEPRYVEEYKKIKGSKVWCIGPVSLCNKDDLDKAERGKKALVNEHECLQWLDSKEPNSVVYVCLGSLCRLTLSQLIELGLGLEASNRPFIWVIRSGESQTELENWLSEERFEERTNGRGLIIKGWAPQVLILSHRAIGAFLTHCGWNSTLEGITAGVPLITWPMFADQFLNEKLIVQVLESGIRVGVNNYVAWGEEEKLGALVKKEDVEKAVSIVMDEGDVGKKRRKRAGELGEMARRAMEEGGSSHLNLTLFIQDMMHLSSQKLFANGSSP